MREPERTEAQPPQSPPEHALVLRGKWSEPGIPHRGWTCVGVEDLGDRLTTCEMCEFQEIRFAHTMEHPDYPGRLVVGCDCAGHMEGNIEEAERRDSEMRNRATRLRNFVSRGWTEWATWRERTIAGVIVRIQPHPALGWQAIVQHPKLGERIVSGRRYRTLDAIKLACFEVVEGMRKRRREQLAQQAENEAIWYGGKRIDG